MAPPAKKVIKSLDDCLPDDLNANRGTQRGMGQLEQSLHELGAGRSILVDRNGIALAGNKTLSAAQEMGLKGKIVHTRGDELVVVVRDDLDLERDARARKMAYADNRISQTGLDWDVGQLQADLGLNVGVEWLWSAEELEQMMGTAAVADAGLDPVGSQEKEADGLETPPTKDRGEYKQADVPDAIWPTDNDYGIPLLDLEWQADAVDAPVALWGAAGSRTRTMRGTWLFYTEDYRFQALWDNPASLLNTECITVVEPNFSCYDQMPRAVGLYRIYQKRWMARYWQSKGVRMIVDLNVAVPFQQDNLMGIPQGWKAYATRGYKERIGYTEQEFELAQERSGIKTPLFLVYGGGEEVRQYSMKRGWLWIPENRDSARSRFNGEVEVATETFKVRGPGYDDDELFPDDAELIDGDDDTGDDDESMEGAEALTLDEFNERVAAGEIDLDGES